jgi:two-component system, OmpR family, response regulator BaeR
MSKTILVAEDDPKIAEIICKYLAMEQFTVHQALTGPETLTLFSQINPDLIILDIMLPGMRVENVCEHIRAKSNVPIIMISALADDAHRLNGFALGTDDYLGKPFNPRELMARIKAILRRASPGPHEPHIISHGPITLNAEEQTVTLAGVAVPLTQIEFNMLFLLMSSPSKVFTRENLLDKSHKYFVESDARSVDFHIKNLRRKINTQPASNYIKSVYGAGYKLI